MPQSTPGGIFQPSHQTLYRSPLTAGSSLRRLTHRRLFPILLLAFVAVLAALSASTRLMWFDELATYEPAHLPSFAQTFSFFNSGLDTPSPLPSLVLHGSMRLLGDGDFRDRLPFLLMFLGSCVLVYAFAAKRYPPLYSAIVFVLPAALGTFLYASEMRAYSFMLFFAALMLFCWQRIDVPATRRAALAGLWFAFAGAVLSHVFAIFLFVPFAAAELTRALLRKRLDKAASAVLLTAPFALLMLLPSMLHAHRYYGGVFWSRPTLAGALAAYGTSFLGDSALFLAFLSVLVTLFLVRARPATIPPDGETQGFTLPEWVLVITLALLPLYAFVGSLVIKVFVTRYTIPFVLGLELVFVGFLAWSSRFSRAVALCILLLVAGVAVVKQRKPILFALRGFRPNPAQQFRSQSWMDAACAIGLPVFASSPHDYMLWHHYGSPCLLAHLHYAVTPAIVARSQDDLNMQLFQRGLPLSIVDFNSFAAAHPEFLLADAQPESPWLLPYLESPLGKSRFITTPLSSFPNTVTEPYRGFTSNRLTLYKVVRK